MSAHKAYLFYYFLQFGERKRNGIMDNYNSILQTQLYIIWKSTLQPVFFFSHNFDGTHKQILSNWAVGMSHTGIKYVYDVIIFIFYDIIISIFRYDNNQQRRNELSN